MVDNIKQMDKMTQDMLKLENKSFVQPKKSGKRKMPR
jgi:hypothetical protein